MAITEIYVDPSIAADSGTGTVGDPFGDLEYAIEQTTFDTTNGTRVNIKAGTDEILAAKLETAMADTGTTVAWVPSETARAVFQGYTAAADDGGIGGISGGGSVGMFEDNTADWITVKDMVVHNVGAANAIGVDTSCYIQKVEVHNGTGTTSYAINVDTGLVQECYVHDWEGYAIRNDNGHTSENYIWDDGATMALGIQCVPGITVENNIIAFDSAHAGVGIQTASLNDGVIRNNSIFSVGGTGKGILITNGGFRQEIANNLVEGFSGAGGIGIDTNTTASGADSVRGNAVYNCTTAYDNNALYSSDNETLSASPFNDAANGDFSPVDTGNVLQGSLPQAWNN
jgi:hypothetical protein